MKFRVLLVDDHSAVRDVLKMILETNDLFEIIGEAENGKEAIELIEQENPDIVLMDLNMPVMTGLDAIKELNKRQIVVPVIIHTAYNEDQMISEAMLLGAKGYLLKGSSREQLFTTMSSVLAVDSTRC